MSRSPAARLFFIAVAWIAAASACRSGERSADSSRAQSKEPGIADTGRVLQQGSSQYAVIARDSCPGYRVVNSRFELAGGFVVKTTEDNTYLQCVEGARSSMTAMVWHEGSDTMSIAPIRSSAERGAIFRGPAYGDRRVPLLEAITSGCCGSPDTHDFWNLRTGKLVFTGEEPLIGFVANGAVRFLSVAGGSGDTVGVVQYGSGAGEPQRLAFTRGGPRGTLTTSDYFVVDSTALEGPRRLGGHLIVGKECCAGKDTVPVSGVTLRLRVRAISGEPALDFAAHIVNDRLVPQPQSARP